MADALSGLPKALLLDADHIVADKDEQLGQPMVPNGIPLSKLHHAAFDAHLIGIDPIIGCTSRNACSARPTVRCLRPCGY
jgi:hypothetical protein